MSSEINKVLENMEYVSIEPSKEAGYTVKATFYSDDGTAGDSLYGYDLPDLAHQIDEALKIEHLQKPNGRSVFKSNPNPNHNVVLLGVDGSTSPRTIYYRPTEERSQIVNMPENHFTAIFSPYADAEFISFINDHIEEGDLDDLVHDVASQRASHLNNSLADGDDEEIHDQQSSLASDINNEGIEAQVRFLVSQGLTEGDITDWLKAEGCLQEDYNDLLNPSTPVSSPQADMS